MPIATLTTRNIPVVVRQILAARGQDVSNLRNPRIIALIDTALETLAYRVAEGDDYQRLQATFEGVPVGGKLTVTDLTTATGIPIFDAARMSIRETVSGVQLAPVDSVHVLQYGDLPTGYVYYVLDGRLLRFRTSAGLFDNYSATVTVTTNYIPTLTGVPSILQGLFFNTLAGLIEQRPEVRAMELSEVGRA